LAPSTYGGISAVCAEDFTGAAAEGWADLGDGAFVAGFLISGGIGATGVSPAVGLKLRSGAAEGAAGFATGWGGGAVITCAGADPESGVEGATEGWGAITGDAAGAEGADDDDIVGDCASAGDICPDKKPAANKNIAAEVKRDFIPTS